MTIEEQIKEKLKEVKDPEFGKSIMERNLIDEIRVENDTVSILFHLTVPFCPDVFALYIGREIKKKAKEVQGINKVLVTLQNHNRAEQLNQILGKEKKTCLPWADARAVRNVTPPHRRNFL